MKTDFFNKLPAQAVSIVLKAYEHRKKGWTDNEYKAHYFAFQEIMGDQHCPAEKFDAVVRYWGKSMKSKNLGYANNRGRFTLQPNKMLGAPYQTKSVSPLYRESPLRDLYAKDAKDCVERVAEEMGVMWS
jgi:hypothetical protein